jgi:hypothetical protein
LPPSYSEANSQADDVPRRRRRRRMHHNNKAKSGHKTKREGSSSRGRDITVISRVTDTEVQADDVCRHRRRRARTAKTTSQQAESQEGRQGTKTGGRSDGRRASRDHDSTVIGGVHRHTSTSVVLPTAPAPTVSALVLPRRRKCLVANAPVCSAEAGVVDRLSSSLPSLPLSSSVAMPTRFVVVSPSLSWSAGNATGAMQRYWTRTGTEPTTEGSGCDDTTASRRKRDSWTSLAFFTCIESERTSREYPEVMLGSFKVSHLHRCWCCHRRRGCRQCRFPVRQETDFETEASGLNVSMYGSTSARASGGVHKGWQAGTQAGKHAARQTHRRQTNRKTGRRAATHTHTHARTHACTDGRPERSNAASSTHTHMRAHGNAHAYTRTTVRTRPHVP